MLNSVQLAASNVFGTVSPPPGVQAYDAKAGGEIGLIVFISSMLQLVTVIAGVWVLFQFFLAGFDYITANGNTAANTKVKDRLTFSIIGLVIIVGSYSIAALLGLILFGDATFIIQPKLQGP
jgi:hypothetical protein